MSDAVDLEGDSPVTVVIARRPVKGKEAEMETFLEAISKETARFPGYLGVSILCPRNPDDPEYRAILKFDSLRHYRDWEHSEARARWLQVGNAITRDPPHVQILSGLETWFSLPGGVAVPTPPRHKMMVVVWLTIYPISTLLNWLLLPLAGDWPLALRSLVMSLILTPIMTYVALPWVTRRFSRWLYPGISER